MTDEELIALYFQRSEQAVAETQRQYGAYCGAIARNILRDERDAEECVSDCWLQAWNAIPPARPTHFKGWLGTVARNRALSMRRAQARQPDTVDEAAMELAACLTQTDGPQERAEARELGEAISAFLYTQKEDCRVAFVRRYWYLDPVEEVARRMGWSLSKTKSVLFRVRGRLKKYLEQEGFADGLRICAGSHELP